MLKSKNKVLIVGLALAQCLALAACGKRAMLAGRNLPGVNGAAPLTESTPAGQPAPTGAPDDGDAAKQVPDPAQPAQPIHLAESIKDIAIDVSSPGTLRIILKRKTAAGTVATVPMTASIQAASAADGTALVTAPGNQSESGKIKCANADCTRIEITLEAKDAAAPAKIRATISQVTALKIELAGKPDGTQGAIAATLAEIQAGKTAGAEMRAMVAKVDQGATIARFDCVITGATADGTPTTRSISLSGKTGTGQEITMVQSSAPAGADDGNEELEGEIDFGEANGVLHFAIGGSEDRIQLLDLVLAK